MRVEIETALKHDVPVLPVLLDDARMPEPSELNDCRVMDFTFEGKTKRYHYCQAHPFATLEAIHAKRDAVAAEVKSCLGPGWAERRSEFSDKTTDTNFYMGPDDPLVRIRESYVKESKEWLLNLEVEASPAAVKQPDPSQPKTDRPLTTPAPSETTPNLPPPPPPPPTPAN